ncbi:MAG TPA: two-component sensor histidine kinase, partial [Burkholderiaceae bacterium]
MTNIQDRSLFRRLLAGFTLVVIGIWLCNLGLDVYETRTSKKKDMQRELQATAKRMLVVLQMSEGNPGERKQALRQMEKLHYA